MAEFDTSGLLPLDTTGLVPVDQQFDTSNLVPLDTSGLVPVDGPGGEAPLSERVSAYETENPFFTRMGQRLKAGFLNIGSSIKGTHAVGEVERLQNIAPFLSRIDQGEKLEPPDFAGTGLLPPERQRIEQYQRLSPEERQNLLGQWQSEIVEAAKSTAEMRAESAAIPRNPAVADFSRAFGSKDYLGATEILLQNPVGIIGQVGTESAPTMLAALAAGIVNPLLGAGVMGGSSAAQEYGSSVIDYIGQQGVDTNDPQALLAALQNRDLVDKAADYATKRAAVIGTVDALSGLVAGKMLVPSQLIAGPVKREAVNELVAQPILQAGMGAVSEAGGQLASTGKINDPAAVALEAIGEFSTAPIEAAAFGTQRFRESAPAPGPQAPPAAPVGAAGGEPSPQAAPATIPDPGTRVGLRRQGAAPEPVVVEAVQDGYVFFRDPDGNVDAATVDDFKRDLTAAPPATKAVDATTVPTPPPEVTAAPPPGTGDINDFDPYAVREPVKARPTEPSPQANLELPDTAKIAALQRQARLWEVAAAEAEERATRGEPGARTPEEIAFMRHSAQQAAAEAAAMARTATPPRVSQDATAATPEQMAARGMGALSAAAPAASEATTGPQTFEVAPKPAPAPAQPTLEPVARSEAEVPQPALERPQQAPVPWQQRLRQRIAARSAPLNNQDLLAKQLGVTPQDVAKELTSIAAGRNAPVQIMQGRVKIDPKTKQPIQSKFAGKFRYTPQPTGKASQSLSQFVADSGGMAPGSFADEITARDLDKASVKFRGRLVNPTARMNVEQMADHALEAGWQIPLDATGQHADTDEFMNMLAQDRAGRRQFYALGEEPIEQGPRPASRQARKAQALARLKELGFEPRGTTVEELENELDAYENIIGDMPRADAPELHLGMENEAVDRLDTEAQDALRQEAKDDFPHEYDEDWYRQEIAEGSDAAQPAAAASLPARGEQAGAEREGAQVTAGRDEGTAATSSSIGAETGRLAATESGQARRFTNLTSQASAQISSVESASSWVVDQGKATGNEYTTVMSTDGSLILAGTSNLKDQTIFAAPTQLRTPGQTVTVLHNHPQTAALSRPDVGLLAFPGAGFVGAVSHNGKVSAAALGSSVKIPTNNDEFDALSRWLSASYEAVSSAFARTEPDIYKRQELVMRTLGASGLLEYHTNHAINGDMVPAVNQAAILARRALTNANILTDRAGGGVLHRPTFYFSPADALAAISKRTAEISAGRNRASNAGVVGKSDLSQANQSSPASRTGAGRNEGVSDNVESTGQFRQSGQVEIDQRRLVPRADRPAVRGVSAGLGEILGRPGGQQQAAAEQDRAAGDNVGAAGDRAAEDSTRFRQPSDAEGESGKYVDLKANVAASISGTSKAAADAGAAKWVTDQGKKTGFEYGVGVSSDGTVLLAGTSNTPGRITLDTAADAVLANQDSAVTYHHNHPKGDPLSQTDLLSLAKEGMEWVVAHGPNGELFAARFSDGFESAISGENPEKRIALRQGAVKAATVNAVSTMNGGYEVYDAAWRALSGAGVIDYVSTMPPSEHLQEATNEIAKSVHSTIAGFGYQFEPGTVHQQAARFSVAEGMARISGGTDTRATEPGAAPTGERGAPSGGGKEAREPGGEAKGAPDENLLRRTSGDETKGVIARLISDESGALTLPDWQRIRDFFSRRKDGPWSPRRIAAEGNKVNLGQPDTLRRMAMVGPYVYNGAHLASMDKPSAAYFNAMLNQQATRSQLETQAFEKAAPYFRLSKEDMRTVDAMLEYYRLYGVTPRRTGRQLVVKIPETRPPFGEAMPTLSKPGQILAADAKMTDAILDLTEMFGDVWRNMHEAIARERGYTGEFSEKAIQARIDGANDRHQKRAATAAMEAWRAMQETARQGYTVPLQRYGDTYISVTPKAPEDAVSINSPVHVEFIDTKSFFRNPFKSQRGGTADQSVDQRIAELRKKFPPSKFNITSGQVTPNSVATLDIPALERALMAMNSATDHKHDAVIDDLLHQVYQNRMAGFRKQARNVGGYSTDFERAIADYIRQTSSTIARLSHRDTIQSAYDATQHHADPAVRKYWENFKHYNEREGGDFNGLRKLGFFMMMWGSPASAALDLTQTPLITQFQLASWAGIRAPKLAHEAMVEALSAIRPTARHGLRVDLSRVGRTDAERALLKSMADEGRLGPQISREFQGSELSSRAKNARPHLKKMAVLWEYGSSMKNAAEEVNRVAAALAAFRAAQNPQLLDKAAKVYADDQLFREQVGVKPDPAALARFFVDDTQFIAGKINRAPAMRGIGSLVFQFKNYPLNYVRLMHKNFTRMGKEGKIVGGMMLVALLMASGLLGAPFAEDALKGGEAIYKGITGIDPMLEYNFRKWAADAGFGEYGAELLTRGIGRNLFGADMGQRIGMGELFPSDSITDTLPLASAIISRIQEMMERGSRGQPAGATAAAANFLFGKGGYDVARAYAQTQEGIKTKYGSTVQSAADTTLGDVALRAMGIQPTKITRKTEKTYAGSRIAAAANDAKNRLTTELATYIVDAGAAREAGDKAKADEITAKLNARIAEVAQQFAEPGTPSWQKMTIPSRTALRRRILSIILPEVARLKATPRSARQEVINIPYPE